MIRYDVPKFNTGEISVVYGAQSRVRISETHFRSISFWVVPRSIGCRISIQLNRSDGGGPMSVDRLIDGASTVGGIVTERDRGIVEPAKENSTKMAHMLTI
jgi:hypothetical protein